ncbi:unnamed protein product [Diatraea saccharalis]|uniref:Fanconi anemia group M protein n=1 Tax=Diatraea saccharalis TaxID=40085 RepID=A0A9N9WL57_9NEOP|nr:unnamed protein product [Diatraea saccharalis]
MNTSFQNKSKPEREFEDEIFDDSAFLANFDNNSFKETKSDLNISALCCDEEISGYDKITGKTWIYPTNYPVRDYQLNIIKASILKNTLVSLPTGLGKTFIAAVIMYNFYRWYPLGKIIFTAPTRPLVAQQIEACYNIIAIPPNDTIEMTGHMHVNTRKMNWQSKRVIFATPQVIYNDIKSGICPGDKIRCLVVDEAHKARGNYAYCQIVSTLTEMGHKTYRILALSATPGSKVEDVISVVKSLHIAHLELRTENCIDVQPYSHSRKINTVIIPLGPELDQLRQQYVEILDGYARRLKQFNILPQNLGNLSKGRVVMLYKEFQTKEKSARHPQHNYIMKDFTLLIALFHGLELLVKHGSRVFLNFFDEHPEKSWIQSDDKLTALLERLRDDLGINPLSLNTSILPDGTIPEVPKNICFGHPKFYKLKEIMLEHFMSAKKKGQDTRAIVFCEYRESVNLVHCLLLQCRPLIMAQMFVGQGASGKDGKTVVSQKQQLRVMRNFREGSCNTLVATCVAEEGLDIGSVDLILCFDISTRSPVRLVQRCGRTGRERGGQVFILVTEGREHNTLLDCMQQRDGLNKKILQSSEVSKNLYKLNPRMMPHDFIPQCQKMFITVTKKTGLKEKAKETDKTKKGQKDLRIMLLGKTSSSSSSSSKEFELDNLISEEEFKEIYPNGFECKTSLINSREFWSMSKEKVTAISKDNYKDDFKLSTWLEWQRTLQKTINIGHSKDSEILSELLQYSDAKRFELPASTQNPTFATQVIASQRMLMSPTKEKPTKAKKNKVVSVKSPFKVTKSPGKRDGDIRALFSTTTKSTKNYTKLLNDLGIQGSGKLPTRLINLLVDLSLESTNMTKTCYICQNVCDCKFLYNMRVKRKSPSINFLVDPKFPSLELIEDIRPDSFLNFVKNVDVHKNLVSDNSLSSCIDEIIEDKIIDEKSKITNSHESDYDFDSLDELNSCILIQEKTPGKNHAVNEDRNSNNNFDLGFDFDSPDEFDIPTISVSNNEKQNENVEKNFEIGDIEDIFVESSPEETETKETVKAVKEEKPINHNEALGFFGLDSIDDIFADYDDSMDNDHKHIKEQKEKEEKCEQNVSPSILSGRPKHNTSTSPILSSQSKKYQLSTKKKEGIATNSKVKRQLITDPVSKPTEYKTESSMNVSNNKSMFTITQIVEMINNPDGKKSSSFQTNKTKNCKNESNLSIGDGDRSMSPILLTQADKKKASMLENSRLTQTCTEMKKVDSLIVLDSDSDSCDETRVYDVDEDKIHTSNIDKDDINTLNHTSSKRKFESDDKDVINASPYFNKKRKLDNSNPKSLTLQQRVLAALMSNKDSDWKPNNNHIINLSVSPVKLSQKENEDPQFLKVSPFDNDYEKDNLKKSNLEILESFRRDKVCSLKNKLNVETNGIKKLASQKRQLTFEDSDDDFVDVNNCHSQKKQVQKTILHSPPTKHKVRKKKRKPDFLELEAELSGESDSGDELSDTSAGSLADFICDDADITQQPDMHAHYIRSVRSPVKGVFKIPELPKKFNNMDVFSQYVEEDNYEMDSFCVDSHIGLTQVDDVSELELAEIVLEGKRKRKKKTDDKSINTGHANGDSPIVRRKNKIPRRIESDSDDST